MDFKFKTSLSDLSAQERVRFARRHRLSHDEAKRFFEAFYQPLPSMIFGAAPTPDRRKRRVETLEKIAVDLRRAAMATRRAVETMRDLMDASPPNDSFESRKGHPLRPLLPHVEESATSLDNLAAQVRQQAAQDFYPEPWDRRRPSRNRDFVISKLLGFWARCGRPLTYTTDDVYKTRAGPLIEFLQDALILLTDPPASLGPESLAKIINEQRASVAAGLKREAEYEERIAAGRDPFD